MMSGAATAFKSCVVITIILNIVSVVEMVAYYFTVFTDNEVTAIGVIATFPFFGRCHSEGSVKQQDFHLVFVE